MRRREFFGVLGGAAALPLAARAQQTMRRVAILMATRDTDPEGQARFKGFLEGFRRLGWIEGKNVHIDVRWAHGSADRTRQLAAEFVALAPDIIVANSTTAIAAIKRVTTSIPVVFVMVSEPVAQGFIASMARPGGNITRLHDGRFFGRRKIDRDGPTGPIRPTYSAGRRTTWRRWCRRSRRRKR